MTGRNTPALYEDPSRLSRMVVISCAVVAALLTFLMILPPLLSLLGHKSITPPHNEIDNAASTARTAAAASLDQLSRTAKPIPLAGDVAEDEDTSTAPIADTSRPNVSNGVELPQQVPQDSAAQTPATNGHSPEKPSTWAAVLQSTPDPGPTLEVDALPVAQPPLPRVRPHRLAVVGIAPIPLPPPRPFISTEATATDREAPRERLDPF
jgi:hypothetical protein